MFPLSCVQDEDEGESRNGSVASVVKVKPRPKVPAAAQAPKNLLLKAMADAQRSMATAPVREVPNIKSKVTIYNTALQLILMNGLRNRGNQAGIIPNCPPSISEKAHYRLAYQ